MNEDLLRRTLDKIDEMFGPTPPPLPPRGPRLMKSLERKESCWKTCPSCEYQDRYQDRSTCKNSRVVAV